MMNRREALRGIVLVLGGAVAAATFAGCVTEPKPTMVPVGASGRFFDAETLAVLATVGEIMIPETDTPGALKANVHGFIDAMMADWASAATQAQFVRALAQVNEVARDRHGRAFAGLATADQAEVIALIDARSFAAPQSPDAQAYRRLKWLVVEGYWTSEVANPDYRLNPGVYKGDLTLAAYNTLLGRG